ncbi:glycosyltransferase family 4 protein [Paenibacillus sp. JSM ZJ436]|uniref:glycosyltransferase family 4 protein n=1 Tax=Paenibacillus sp. JSM ZJ436 TaxID=3376190 RepID=UPI003791E9FE
MNICIVTHCVKKGDGQGRVNYEVVKKALEHGYKITIISSDLSIDLHEHPNVTWIRIAANGIPSNLLKNQYFAIVSALLIWSHKARADLIIANGFITYAKSDINCVHLVHSTWANSKYHPIRRKKNLRTIYHFFYNQLNAVLEKYAFKKTGHIIAVSSQVKHELQVDAKVNKTAISVIHNGVDTDEFSPKLLDRENYKLNKHKKYGLFAGDLKSGIKNFETVLYAISKVDGFELLVLGDANHTNYPELANRLGIKDRVHFLGYRKDIADIMSLADIFIFPSRYESFSLVILEALATGLPVIMSTCCGVVDLMTEDSVLLLNDPNDAEQLSQLIKQLINNPDKLSKMSLEARNVALKNQWVIMADKYLELFKEYSSELKYAK